MIRYAQRRAALILAAALSLTTGACDEKVKVTIKVKTVDAGSTNMTSARPSTVTATSTRTGIVR